MIEFKHGDILNDDAEALVNTVNCVGVMGRGIALQFSNAFPENCKSYVKACHKDEVKPGIMFVFKTGRLTPPFFIINFPTKRHWRGKSKIEDIDSGLASLISVVKENNIRSLAIPPLGSGLGGLDWLLVKSHLIAALEPLADRRISIYEPFGAPASEKIVHPKSIPAMTKGRAALIVLMDQYLRGLLDPFVTLLEIHKLMYFLQESGEPLNLNFKKAQYGPYAENLRHVLRTIDGYFISGYADGNDTPYKHLKLIPGAIEDANQYLREFPETNARIEKVKNLVQGYESPFGLELLSTVHWLMKSTLLNTEDEIQKAFYSWSSHKKHFTPRQILVAIKAIQNLE